MSNVRIQTNPGATIHKMLETAYGRSSGGNTVEFIFNLVEIHVNSQSDLSLLYRDYRTAVILKIPKIGPTSLAQEPQHIIDALAAAR